MLFVTKSEVDCMSFGLDARSGCFDFGRYSTEFLGTTRDEEDVETLAGKLKGEFSSNTVGCTGNDCPSGTGEILLVRAEGGEGFAGEDV